MFDLKQCCCIKDLVTKAGYKWECGKYYDYTNYSDIIYVSTIYRSDTEHMKTLPMVDMKKSIFNKFFKDIIVKRDETISNILR